MTSNKHAQLQRIAVETFSIELRFIFPLARSLSLRSITLFIQAKSEKEKEIGVAIERSSLAVARVDDGKLEHKR